MIKSTVTNKEIWRIAYPIMLGNLAQTIITFTDYYILGPPNGFTISPWE